MKVSYLKISPAAQHCELYEYKDGPAFPNSPHKEGTLFRIYEVISGENFLLPSGSYSS